MPETINLIPQEERIQQTKTKVVKVSTIISVVLLVIVAGVGGFFYYRVYTLRNELKELDAGVANLRSQISSLSEIEIEARNLYKKSQVLEKLFNERIYYSTLLTEFAESTPEQITVNSLGMGKDTSLSVSGRADTYNAVQEFTNQLLGNEVFTSVELNSVGLDTKDDRITFFIVVNYDEDLLHE